MNKKNILFIVHNYNSFQKDQIESVSKYFENVYVLIRFNPIFRLAYFFSLGKLKKFSPSYSLDCYKKPANVILIVTPVWYLPIGIFYKNLGEPHFKAAQKAIVKNNIEFDLIHSHFLWSSGYAGAKLKEKYNVPLVLTGHGYDVYSLPHKNPSWREKISMVIKQADIITTPSESNLRVFKELGFDQKVKVIPNGYHKSLFYPLDMNTCRRRLGVPLKPNVIINVGNLEKVKGHIHLIHAVRKLTGTHPSILCFIVGDGSLKRALKREINRLNLGKNIFLLGAKKHKDLVEWINASNVFVMPSIKESFGVAQVEALACGNPVVATKNGGSEEIITNFSHGILCEPNDSTALSQAINTALNKNWDSSKIVDYASKFSWETLGGKFWEVYRNFINI